MIPSQFKRSCPIPKSTKHVWFENFLWVFVGLQSHCLLLFMANIRSGSWFSIARLVLQSMSTQSTANLSSGSQSGPWCLSPPEKFCFGVWLTKFSHHGSHNAIPFSLRYTSYTRSYTSPSSREKFSTLPIVRKTGPSDMFCFQPGDAESHRPQLVKNHLAPSRTWNGPKNPSNLNKTNLMIRSVSVSLVS